MKTTRTVLAFVVLMMGVLAAEPAFAWGHSRVRVGVGLYIGVPFVGYPYYYPPYHYAPYYYPAYYPPPVVVQQQAPVYVEQNPQPAPAAQPQSSGYWYYCADSRAYYPYVKECPGGWQRVAPQPG